MSSRTSSLWGLKVYVPCVRLFSCLPQWRWCRNVDRFSGELWDPGPNSGISGRWNIREVCQREEIEQEEGWERDTVREEEEQEQEEEEEAEIEEEEEEEEEEIEEEEEEEEEEEIEEEGRYDGWNERFECTVQNKNWNHIISYHITGYRGRLVYHIISYHIIL